MQLLDRECYDIDIALDNMLGKEFCDKVEEYMKCAGEEPRGRADIKRFIFSLCLLLFCYIY